MIKINKETKNLFKIKKNKVKKRYRYSVNIIP